MGHHEQIGEANRQYRARRAAMHPLRRRLGDALGTIAVWLASALVLLLMVTPLVLWAVW